MKIEYLPPVRVAYFRKVGVYGLENQVLMKNFKRWVKAEGLWENAVILGIALDDPTRITAKNCRYDVCLVTNKTNFKTCVKQRVIQGQKVVVFKIKHTEEVIGEFYGQLAQIISKNRLKVLKQPLIERYKVSLVQSGYCEILIPIK